MNEVTLRELMEQRWAAHDAAHQTEAEQRAHLQALFDERIERANQLWSELDKTRGQYVTRTELRTTIGLAMTAAAILTTIVIAITSRLWS